MAAESSPHTEGLLDHNIPQWKRELILRRRALGRALPAGSGGTVRLTCPSVVAGARHPAVSSALDINTRQHYKHSVEQNYLDSRPLTGNMRLIDQMDVSNDLMINGVGLKNNRAVLNSSERDTCAFQFNSKMGEEKSINLKKQTGPTKTMMDKLIIRSSRQLQVLSPNNSDRPPTNGNEEDCQSDSGEELQYGPGIVNRLKHKYLSLTLRDNQNRYRRPSLSNLRRATSLENMLDEDVMWKHTEPKTARYTKKTEKLNIGLKSAGLSSYQMKCLGIQNRSDLMKRAQSMDTLLKSVPKVVGFQVMPKPFGIDNVISGCSKPVASIVNEDIVIVENSEVDGCDESITRRKRTARCVEEKELPPPDVVKQTLKIFETSPTRKPKPINSQPKPSHKTNAVHPSKINTHLDKTKVSAGNKPLLSPKPFLSPEKLRSRPKVMLSSPKKHQPATFILPMPDVTKKQTVSEVTITQDKQSLPSPIVPSPAFVSPNFHLNENAPSFPISKVMTNGRPESLDLSQSCSEDSHTSSDSEEDNLVTKPVPRTALENIRKGGVSMQFNFGNEKSTDATPKSYLPTVHVCPQATNTALLATQTSSPMSPERSPRAMTPLMSPDSPVTQMKQVGIIRPIVTHKIQSQPATLASQLTEQEIEKNLINRVKSIEHPLSKVVVAIKSMPDNVVVGSVTADLLSRVSPEVGLWDKKPWQNQNSMVFNFCDRKVVPDYIENDGIILRGKQDRLRDGCGPRLDHSQPPPTPPPDADWHDRQRLLDTPSPCDVTFENDNVLINGRSNLSRQPRQHRQHKLRIQFNDEATELFEYPSEASLVEEESGLRASEETDVGSMSSQPLPLPLPLPLGGGGPLASYTPSKQTREADWQLGVSQAPGPAPTRPQSEEETEEEQYLKPAQPGQSALWSEETATSDLLF